MAELTDADAYLSALLGGDGGDADELDGGGGGVAAAERRVARVDLLLGVQGWRRFVYADPTSFLDAGTVAAKVG